MRCSAQRLCCPSHTEASDRLLSWATDRADEEQAIFYVAGEESEAWVKSL